MVNVALGLLVYAAEGDLWLEQEGVGASTLDEALWFVSCTFHGTSFGDFYPRTTPGRVVAMLVALLGYFFFALKMCVILLSQLAGEPLPTTFSVPKRMVRGAAPSFALLVLVLLVVSAFSAGVLSPWPETALQAEGEPANLGEAFYFAWCVTFRSPYGEIIPRAAGPRVLTSRWPWRVHSVQRCCLRGRLQIG